MDVLLARRLAVCALLSGSLAAFAASPPATAEVEVEVSGPPLPLREAIRRTLEANADLAVFGYELRAQEGRVLQAGFQPNPELSVDVEDALGTGDHSGLRVAQTTISLHQVLERGASARRVDAASAGRSLLDAELSEKRLDTAAEAARRFVQVLSDQAQLELTHEALTLAAKTVDAARLRVRAARSPAAELARAEAAQARADLDRQHAEHQLLTSRRQLAALWGETEPAFGPVQGALLELPPLQAYETLRTRLAGNPSLARFVAEARLRDAEVRLAEQSRRQAWQVSAGIRRHNDSDDFSGVFGVSIPLPWRNPAQGLVAEANAKREQVDASRHAAEVQTLTKLFEWFQQLKQARTEADTLEHTVLPKMQDALRQTEYAYARGRYGYTELVSAQQELLVLQRARIQAAANAQTTAIEIDRLTGTLPGGTAQEVTP